MPMNMKKAKGKYEQMSKIENKILYYLSGISGSVSEVITTALCIRRLRPPS